MLILSRLLNFWYIFRLLKDVQVERVESKTARPLGTQMNWRSCRLRREPQSNNHWRGTLVTQAGAILSLPSVSVAGGQPTATPELSSRLFLSSYAKIGNRESIEAGLTKEGRMKLVASLRYGVIFKKAFCDLEIFTTFVHDVLGIDLEITKVETEKSFAQPIGQVIPRFDLYAEDVKNRVIVDIQHERLSDHYDRFLYYHCAALLEQISKAANYRPPLKVYTIVVLTSGDWHGKDVAVIDFDPHDLQGHALGEIPHKVFYLCPKYANDQTPALYRDWLDAINDSLDGQVDEARYTRDIIHKLFLQIEQDAITPADRTRMIEEHHEEELQQSALEQGIEIGTERGKLETAHRMRAKGMGIDLIAELTGLSPAEITQA